MTRLILTSVSLSISDSVGRLAANEARSASTASIWLIAERIPSTIPISTSFSIVSTLGNFVTLVKREPSFVFSNLNVMRIVGMSSLRRPSSCENPSSTSMTRNGSTLRKWNHPCDLLPSGPVIE